MEREDTLVHLLGEELRRRLGSEYVVNPNFLSGPLEESFTARPDLVIRSRYEPRRVYIVEVKLASRQNFDLPLATAGQTKRILQANTPQFDPVLILATNAHVGNVLASELEAQRVEVVQTGEMMNMASDIADTIRAKERQVADARVRQH